MLPSKKMTRSRSWLGALLPAATRHSSRMIWCSQPLTSQSSEPLGLQTADFIS